MRRIKKIFSLVLTTIMVISLVQVPLVVKGEEPFSTDMKVAAGRMHTLVLRGNGTVWACGRNSSGQLGDGTTTDRNKLVQVSGLENIKEIAAGYAHSLALDKDGNVWAWGSSNYRSLIDTEDNVTTPTPIESLSGIIAIAAGNDFSLALDSAGNVYSWGLNYHGKLGNGVIPASGSGTQTTPQEIPYFRDNNIKITAISARGAHGLALDSAGNVWSWGENNYGQLGNGTTGTSYSDNSQDSGTPAEISDLSDKGITAISAGQYFNLALSSSGGYVYGWGDNSYGELGNGETPESDLGDNIKLTPVKANDLTGIKEIVAGGYISLALDGEGNVYAWGNNNYRQLGVDEALKRNTPEKVSSLTVKINAVQAFNQNIAIDENGKLWVWGSGQYGELGIGSNETKNPTPTLLQTATASASSEQPTAGDDNTITFTVKDAFGDTDTSFVGDRNITISGVEAAPDGTYGKIKIGTDATAEELEDTIKTIAVNFTEGQAQVVLQLNKAEEQTINFSIDGVSITKTNSLTITPTAATIDHMVVTQDIEPPTENGGSFAKQPIVALTDAFGNICKDNNTTEITASQNDVGDWTLTGTTTVKAVDGVVSFADLGAKNSEKVIDVQLSFNGENLAEVLSQKVTLIPPEPPETPSIASITAGDAKVVITWGKVIRATRYELYQSTESNQYTTSIATITPNEADSAFSYTVTGLENGQKYYFTIKAANGGRESGYATEVSATPQVPAPGVPVITTAIVKDQQVDIVWNEVPGATGYKIYTSTQSGDYTASIDTVAGSVYHYDIGGLTNGTTYYFVIRAVNPGGESNYSNEISAVPMPVPNAPRNIKAEGGNSRAIISFDAPENNGGPSIIGYTVTSSPGGITAEGSQSPITITGLTNGTEYTFTVKAKNTVGESEASEPSNQVKVKASGSGGSSGHATEVNDTPAPGAPVINTAIVKNQQVDIEWKKVAGATAYKIYTSTQSGSYTAPIDTVAGSVTHYDIGGLTNGTTYYFVIRAVNPGGESNYSNEISAVLMPVPNAPRNIKAEGGNSRAIISFDAPENNGGPSIIGYTVTSSPGGITAEGSQSPITITGLTNGTEYTFTVKAKNTVGESEASEPSNQVKVKASSSGRASGHSSHSSQKTEQSQELTVIVDGTKATIGQTSVKEDNGKKTVEINLYSEGVNKIVEEILKDGKSRFEIPVQIEDKEQIITQLSNDIIQKMEENNIQLSIKSKNIDYSILVKEIVKEQVAKALGVPEEDLEEFQVEIKINTLDQKEAKVIKEKAKENQSELLTAPVDFKLTAKTTLDTGEEKEVTISRFSQYAEIEIELPEDIELDQITTGIIYNEDGTFAPVPTEIYEKEGKYFAKIKTLGDSIYTVVSHNITLASVENHWAKDAVNDLASRFIIKDPEIFTPNELITRGVFAEYITKALGIYRTGAAQEKEFSDVDLDDELADAITIAADYGIIKGYEEGTFRPGGQITREEAMVMYKRAMDIIGLEIEDSNKIEKYQDKDKVSTWAYKTVKAVTGAGVFNGITENTIDPKGSFTYAEAATAVRNLLIKAELINE